ncbi:MULTISPECIES: hypothetical protein [Rheinheimera]|uniref:Uncharacterized protein n=1 Tax=Rheinheimera marina TaxID=1774958 RepID=A0ABV9JJQ3_9GAMM
MTANSTSAAQESSQLREINRLKRKLCFGNIPPFYHSVATSLGMAEGMFKYGFDNSLDILTNQQNWNVKLLGGTDDGLGTVICPDKPRLSIYKVFTPHGFEVHCIPWKGNKEFDFDLVGHPLMDFKFWHPGIMRTVFKIAGLHTFIKLYFEHGDDADLQLIRHAHNLSEDFVEKLAPQFNTQKVFGVSVKNFFDFAEMKHKAGEEIYLPTVYALQDDH